MTEASISRQLNQTWSAFAISCGATASAFIAAAEPKPDQRAKAGGADRDRTGDPLLAKQVLSQLSYSPTEGAAKMVGLGRVELPTSPLSGVRSNQLSYRPALCALPCR